MTSEITPTGSAASALRKIYKQIDALCIDAREAAAPADNVGTGVQRVLAGEDPTAVASELRAASHAKDLRVAITSQAIDKLTDAAAALEAGVRNRKVPMLRAAGGLPTGADSVKELIDNAFAREDANRAAGQRRRDQEKAYDDAMAAYQKAKRAYERKRGSGAMSGFNPAEHLTTEQMDALHPAGGIAGGRYRRSDFKDPPSTWQQNGGAS